MTKYVIEADLSSGDCSFCPCYQRVLNDAAECSLAGREMVGELRKSNSRSCDHVMCYDRPDWCPLIPFERMVVSEWVESVNSQPTKDEPKETIRVELYKSENEKLGGLSIAHGLSIAQMVAKLIDDCKTAKPYVNHGDHGPEPRFEGDAWTVWYCCGNCDHPVSYGDAYCKTCGAELDWSK